MFLYFYLLFLFTSLGLIFDSEVNTEGVKLNRKQQALMVKAWSHLSDYNIVPGQQDGTGTAASQLEGSGFNSHDCE